MIELLVPIAVLAVAIAAIRAAGVFIAKPKGPPRRVYTQPVISGSWGVQQQQKSQAQPEAPQQTDSTTTREQHP